MASIKSLFDSQCGSQAPIVSLSKNFSQSNSLLSSLSINKFTDFSSHVDVDLISQEYLKYVSSQKNIPNTFNMYHLLKKYSPLISSNFLQIKQKKLNPKPESSLLSFENWIDEFKKNFPSKNNFKNYVIFQNQSNLNQNLLKNIWTQSQNQKSLYFSHKILACEFLEQFDNISINDKLKNEKVNANFFTHELWTNEFLERNNADFLDYKELNEDAYEIFSQYENEWKSIEYKLNSTENYSFITNNLFTNEDNLLKKAEVFFANGNILDATMCYEAALQNNPTDAETWCSLGLCHAENEKDEEAIIAFKYSLELEPLNKRTLLASAVSLANEGFESAALRHLDQWISIFNNDLTNLSNVSVAFIDESFIVTDSWIASLEEKFILSKKLINCEKIKENINTKIGELQNSLSIFYNLTQNYERAVEAIWAAIAIKPSDPVLWNRLGASLANSDRSTEAISAYRKALEIFPTYVRARYNLGVSCMNLSAYKDAIEHFLSAISLQKTNQNSQIWLKLRLCAIRLPEFSTQSKWSTDVLNAIESQNIDELKKLNFINF